MYKNTDLKPSVLIVEDEEAIIAMLQYNLEKEGYNVRSTVDSEEALIMIEESKPDLILLDWMLPSLSGVEVCNILRRNRKTANIPIIMLSAKGEEADKVQGLDCGADDYLTKPFSPAELLSRIKAVFRRIRPAFSETTLIFENVEMDLTSRKVLREKIELHMGPTEFRILQCLMEHPTRVLSRDQLIRKVWDIDTYVEPRTVDVHINRLRKVLSCDGKYPNIVKTVRSAGYCLATSDDMEE